MKPTMKPAMKPAMKPVMKPGSKVGITACSNGLPLTSKEQINVLADILVKMGLVPIISPFIYQNSNGCNSGAKERGKALMDIYRQDDIEAVFDISGGDLANGILEYLDYNLIRKNPKPFFGYSDLTTVINGIYTKTGCLTYLYQIRNLYATGDIQARTETAREQQRNFSETLLQGGSRLFWFHYRFCQQYEMKGVVVGGNIRCLLKLAGTPYFPDVHDKIIFLESRSGDRAKLETFMYQLKQMGVFQQAAGVLLGTFSELDRSKEYAIENLLMEVADDPSLPIAKTEEIGHGSNAKCLVIGKEYSFRNQE